MVKIIFFYNLSLIVKETSNENKKYSKRVKKDEIGSVEEKNSNAYTNA